MHWHLVSFQGQYSRLDVILLLLFVMILPERRRSKVQIAEIDALQLFTTREQIGGFKICTRAAETRRRWMCLNVSCHTLLELSSVIGSQWGRFKAIKGN